MLMDTFYKYMLIFTRKIGFECLPLILSKFYKKNYPSQTCTVVHLGLLLNFPQMSFFPLCAEIARQATQMKLMRKLEKQALARAAKEARKQQGKPSLWGLEL